MTCKALLISELKARRQTLGWSLAEVGQRCGIEERFLDDWEHGVSWPRLDAVDSWATVLGLKLAVALEGTTPRRGLHVDWNSRHISVDGTTVRLTPMEWKALERLAAVPGELVTHQALFSYLYGDDRPYSAQSTAIRVLITKLRRLLPLRIEAQWGRGYVLSDLPASSPEHRSRGEYDTRSSARPTASSRPAPVPQTRDRVLSTPARSARRLDDFGERNEPVIHRPAAAPTRFLPHRAEELQVIERFLAERGATRCPDVATIERAPLPTLVWDKIKRKWVRPNGEAAVAR